MAKLLSADDLHAGVQRIRPGGEFRVLAVSGEEYDVPIIYRLGNPLTPFYGRFGTVLAGLLVHPLKDLERSRTTFAEHHLADTLIRQYLLYPRRGDAAGDDATLRHDIEFGYMDLIKPVLVPQVNLGVS